MLCWIFFSTASRTKRRAPGWWIGWPSTGDIRDLLAWCGRSALSEQERSTDFLRELLDFVNIPRTGTDELSYAHDLGFAELEDAMQVSAAMIFGAQFNVTRNGKDFARSEIRVLTPTEALKVLL